MTADVRVPFGDLRRDYAECGASVSDAVSRVLSSGWYVLGNEVAAFEAAFSRLLGGREVVGVGNGTDAIQLALRALGVAVGDFVITVPFTAVPTVLGISATGAAPLFVDVEPATLTMDPAALRALLEEQVPLLGKRIKAIVPVHLYGQCADMPAILAVAREFGLPVVEDSAQAAGAAIAGHAAGTMGDLAAFSFYPSKNLGCYGDGGAVACADPALAARVQAAILGAKLPQLAEWNERRRAIAAAYDCGITAAGVTKPVAAPGAEHVYHLYVVRHPQRDSLAARLAEAGIGTLIHYPIPAHLQVAYADLALGPGSFPVSERAAAEVLSLPMFPQLTDDEVASVCDSVNEFGG